MSVERSEIESVSIDNLEKWNYLKNEEYPVVQLILFLSPHISIRLYLKFGNMLRPSDEYKLIFPSER